MKASQITFYAVGLNETNFAFNTTAFNSILTNGVIKENGNPRVLTLGQPLAFGTPFNITAEEYAIYKSATYIKIVNTYTSSMIETRYAFINNFMELANGNYSVAYTLDDYTNYILCNITGSQPHIDGFTERANVPLYKKTGNVVKSNFAFPFTESKATESGQKYYKKMSLDLETYTELPLGYTCLIYLVSKPKFKGVAQDSSAHGTIYYYNIETGIQNALTRINSNTYIMIFDNHGYNVPLLGRSGTATPVTYTVITSGGNFQAKDITSDTIEKVLYYGNKCPTILGNRFATVTYTDDGREYAEPCLIASGTTEAFYKFYITDIADNGNISAPDKRRYLFGLSFSDFSPVKSAQLPAEPYFQDSEITLQNNYDNYIAKSLYQYIDEVNTLKIKYLTTEITTPKAHISANQSQKVYISLSGDASTIIITLQSYIESASKSKKKFVVGAKY